jgi:phage shock protein C
MSKKKLYKSRKNRMIFGVCGGIAEYLNMDVTIVRVLTGLLVLLKGVGLLIYILCAIVMPFEDFDPEADTDNLKSANINPEEEGDSNKSSKSGERSSKLHSDEEFDSFFKK